MLALVFVAIATIILCSYLYCYRSKSTENLKDWHIVITGGSSGIGKAAGIEVAKKGANVTIIARNEEKLKNAQKEISAFCLFKDQKINYLSLDVSENLEKVEEAFNNLEPVDMLINCAGAAVCNKIEDTTEKDFRYMLELNVLGTIFPSQVIARKMMKRKSGIIVITGSQASLVGIYGMSAYCTAKSALRGFAETLYFELTEYNVSVTFALPPDTNTPGFENEQKGKPEATKKICEVSGLAEPDFVARQLIEDALNRKFFSYTGFDGFLITTLCAGMSPIDWSIIYQIFSMGLFRMFSAFYILNMKRIIASFRK